MQTRSNQGTRPTVQAVVWANARAMQATMSVTLRCDGAWVTGGTVNGAGHAIIPCQFIVAVELPRERS